MNDQEPHIFHRFQDALSERKATASLEHGSKRSLHRTLASVHKTVFSENVKSLDEARERHAAIVALAGVGADADDDEAAEKNSAK